MPALQRLLSKPLTPRSNLAAAVFSLALALWAHFPGHVPYDGLTIWYEAREGVHFSQHPPTFALLWRGLEAFHAGPGGVLVLQLLCLYGAACLMLRWTRPPLLPALAFYAGLLLWPAFFAISPYLVKDVLGAHFAVAGWCLALLAPPGKARPPALAGLALAGLALACVAALLRYQFALPLVVLIAAVIWRNRAGAAKKFSASAAAALATCGGVVAAITVANLLVFAPQVRAMPDPPSALRKIMMFDIAGVVAADPRSSLSVFGGVGVSAAALRGRIETSYTPQRVDTLWSGRSAFALIEGVSNAVVFEQWRASVLQSPGAFLAHRANAYLMVLGMGELYGCTPVYAGISPAPRDLAEKVGAAGFAAPRSTPVILHRYFPSGSFIFRPWVYAVIALALVVGGLAGRVAFAPAILAGGALLYELSFLPLPQACDVRYSYYLMLAAGFAVAAALFSHFTPASGRRAEESV